MSRSSRSASLRWRPASLSQPRAAASAARVSASARWAARIAGMPGRYGSSGSARRCWHRRRRPAPPVRRQYPPASRDLTGFGPGQVCQQPAALAGRRAPDGRASRHRARRGGVPHRPEAEQTRDRGQPPVHCRRSVTREVVGRAVSSAASRPRRFISYTGVDTGNGTGTHVKPGSGVSGCSPGRAQDPAPLGVTGAPGDATYRSNSQCSRAVTGNALWRSPSLLPTAPWRLDVTGRRAHPGATASYRAAAGAPCVFALGTANLTWMGSGIRQSPRPWTCACRGN